MFWRIPNFSASSPVEAILDKEDFTLEELLDEEDTIQECKALNTRLINFLRDRAQVEKLLWYIVEDAPTDAESNRVFKFPFIACEIFTCEIDVILKTLVEDDELMDILFSFLEPNHIRNNLLAGYFSKVVLCLMLRKTTSLMKYVQTHDSIFLQLIDLIGITSIMEILVRLVGTDDHMYPNFMDVMQWLADSNLLEMIVDKLKPSSSPEVHANAAEVLWAITRNAPSALAAKLTSPSFVSRILSHALEDSSSKSSLVYSLSVCISLLDPKRSASTALIHSIRSQHLYELSIPVDPETIDAILPKLGDLLRFLNVSSDVDVLPTTFGELRPPLGKHRLKIVEFIAALLGTGAENAEQELTRSGAIQRTLDLFFEYPFNNFLHHHVENIILSCLDSKNVAIVDHLLYDCNIVAKLLLADKNSILSGDSSRLTLAATGRQSPRVGYIGHITRITNKLVQLGIRNDHIGTYLQGNAEWIHWQSSILHERNTMENVCRWACGRPTSLQDRTRDSDEDEHQDRDYDVTTLANNLNQAFRYSVYENDDADEDVYFDDESAEVVISALRLGDDQEKYFNFYPLNSSSFMTPLQLTCLFLYSGTSPFTNSNWFAFQEEEEEERISEEPLSTSALDRMEDINLNGTGNAGEDSDQVLVGEDEELAVTSSPFQFETSGNDDLFNDQQLPDWVGWREPSDIHVDVSAFNLTTLADPVDIHVDESGTPVDPVDPGVSHIPDNDSEACTSHSLFEEDAEFVGVERVFCARQKPGGDGPGVLEFCDKNHWRVEPEVGVVQE